MKPHPGQLSRILAISPSSRGFGYAVLEGDQFLVDWGVRNVGSEKNNQTLLKTDELISKYDPHVLALQDHSAPDSKRRRRIRDLGASLETLARNRDVRVDRCSIARINQSLGNGGRGTKQHRAEIIATLFPDELGTRLPPKRRPWMTEHYRMDIFDAIGLAITAALKTTGQ
jgi:hypothetical protein